MLIWVPLIFFWLFTPLEIYYIRYSPFQHIPWDCVNSSKVVVTALLITSSFIELVYYEIEGYYTSQALVKWFTPLLKFITFCLSLILILWNHRNGLPRSGLLFWLWLFLSLGGVVQLCREIMSLLAEGMDAKPFQSIAYLTYYFLILVNFFLTFFKESSPKGVKYSERVDDICPDALVSYPSLLTAAWIRPILKKANKGKIYDEDLFEIKHELTMEAVVGKFEEKYFQVKARKYKETDSRWEMTRSKLCFVLAKCFVRTFMFGLFLAFLYINIYYLGPQVLRLILIYADNDDLERRTLENVVYPAIMFVIAISLTILQSQYMMRVGVISLKTRIIFISEIFKKSLRLSMKSRKKESIGEIVNLMNVDVQRVTDTLQYLFIMWGIPMRIMLALYSLHFEIGNAVTAAFQFLILFVCIQTIMGFYTRYYTSKSMEFKDKRMKFLTEVLSHMRILKFYVWEPSFLKIINELRAREICYLRKLYYIHIISVFLSTSTPFLMTLISFSYYVLKEGNTLTPEVAFVSLVLIEMLQLPLSRLPKVILGLIQLAVSFNRIGRFLIADELETKPKFQDEEEDIGTASIINGYFACGESIILRDVNLHLPKGCLKAIFGPTGSGKSSILAALSGEIYKLSGSVTTKGKVAVVSQVPWIQNETLRDVILFGKAYDNELYEKIIKACGLRSDIESLARGDLTCIGSKGVNLSLGQKQKICLARAFYSEADLYFLDDPISALDDHVARRIFKKVISHQGLLAGKTRLVVTTNIDYLHLFDVVILMEQGKVVAEASYKQLLKSGKLLNLLRSWSDTKLLKDLKQFWTLRLSDDRKRGSFSVLEDRESFVYRPNYNTDNLMISNLSYYRPSLHERAFTSSQNIMLLGSEENELIPAGKFRCSVFWKYVKIMGRAYSINCIVFGIFAEVFYFLSTIWLAQWAEQDDNPNIKQENAYYVTVYALFGFGLICSTAIYSYSIYMGALRASIAFHDELLNSVFRMPMSFFDQTPLGRLLNRFGGDVYTIDSHLPMNMQYYISTSFRVVGVLVVALQYYPIVFPAFIVVILSYLLLQNYFLDASRQLALLETKSKSPIFSHFEETLSGVAVIRAYKAEEKFISINRSNIERNLSIAFHTVIANRWLDVRMETIGHIFHFLAIVCILFTPSFNASMIALAISYVVQISGNLNILVQYAASINSDCVCAERINEYIEKPKEPAWDSAPEDVPSDWPKHGGIKFENLIVKYHNSNYDVLNEISFAILPSEKISIVGGTGSGKTTLMHSLFRIIEARMGAIYIDGVDISKVGLGRLRSSLNIIPQDPVIFSGTLRMNLDPGGNFTDTELWDVIHESHLGHFATELGDGLNHIIDAGTSFSVGERQMLCIARALLRKTKILVIDEATYHIDWWSENLMKKAINTHFSDCTILTVDHRLKNVLDSDRVLVLSNGRLAEFDTPQKLLENPDGIFYSLALQAGIISSELRPNNLKPFNEQAESETITSGERSSTSLDSSFQITTSTDLELERIEEETLELMNPIPKVEKTQSVPEEQIVSDETESSPDATSRVQVNSKTKIFPSDTDQENQESSPDATSRVQVNSKTEIFPSDADQENQESSPDATSRVQVNSKTEIFPSDADQENQESSPNATSQVQVSSRTEILPPDADQENQDNEQ